MGHDEKSAIGRFSKIILISGPEFLAPTETGTVYLSGPNIWFFDGTDQVIIK